MQTFLATLLLIGVAMGAMALGVMLSGRALRGSCGGVGSPSCACTASQSEGCKFRKAVADRAG